MRRITAAGLIALLAAAIPVACDDEPAGPGPGAEFTLDVGESETLDTVHARVSFLSVSEDSRCPLRAQCVWAGNGAVVLEIAPADADAAEDTLHTNPESGPRSVVLGRFELTLLRLDPYPETPGGIASEDYRATLVLYERLVELAE